MTTTNTTTAAQGALNEAEMVALVAAFKTSAIAKIKAGLEEGTYQIDTTVHLLGSITKEAAKESIVAQSACPWKIAMVAMNMLNGVSIDRLVKDAAAVTAKEEKDMKERVRVALDAIKAPTRKVVAGRTLANITATKVNDVQ